jgi:hypothetical protein
MRQEHYSCENDTYSRCRRDGIHDASSMAYYYGEGVGNWKGIAHICKWQMEHPENGGWYWFREVCPQCLEEHQ